jgi:hypothetical protein
LEFRGFFYFCAGPADNKKRSEMNRQYQVEKAPELYAAAMTAGSGISQNQKLLEKLPAGFAAEV